MKAIVNAKIVFPEEIREGTIITDGRKIIAAGDCTAPADAEIIDARGLFVGPGFIDQHTHGYSRFGEAHSVYGDMKAMAYCHLLHGTTSITPSPSYSHTMEEFLTAARECHEEMKNEKTSIVGLFYEGPFTSPNEGACSTTAWPYSDEACDTIFKAGGKAVLHCTYAPEMPWGESFEKILQKYDIVADIGHTDLSPEDAERAVKNGAKIVTHLYDAMGCCRGRDSANVTGTLQEQVADILLSIPGLYYELICDSCFMHVKPTSIRLAYRTAGEDCIIVVSDSTGDNIFKYNDRFPADSPVNAEDLYYNDAGELSGSRLCEIDCVRNFMHATGADVRVGFKVGSTNPAKALRIFDRVGSVAPGKDADLAFVDEDMYLHKLIFKGDVLEGIRVNR